MREKAEKFAFTHFDVDSAMQGISSVTAPEIGLVLPGSTFTVLDSHSCTVGALGAAAWASCAGDVLHTLATQTSILKKPPLMRITLDGRLGNGVTAKDIMLNVIRQLGIAGAAGFAIEFAGPVIRDLPMEGRFTVCNMAVELGARFALISPDQTTVDYLKGRPYAPAAGALGRGGPRLACACLRCQRGLRPRSDPRRERYRAADHLGHESAGRHQRRRAHSRPRAGERSTAAQRRSRRRWPILVSAPAQRSRVRRSISCSSVRAPTTGFRICGWPHKWRAAARSPTTWSLGSYPVRRACSAQAEAEGLDAVFLAAGFRWGEPGCSMCGGQGNGFTEILKPHMRAVSTINRNFPNRQGPNSITHLASPPMAAAAAVCGQIVDVRKMNARA